MSLASVVRVILIYLLAVLVGTVLATIVQTQINVSDLQRTGIELSGSERMAMTGKDLLSFTPLMTLLTAVTYLFAFPVAELIGRILKPWRAVVYFLAGAVGIWVAFRITDMAAPPPTFIAATREIPGTLAMMAMAGLGAVLFALLTRPKARRGLRVLG
jgi:urea transporter